MLFLTAKKQQRAPTSASSPHTACTLHMLIAGEVERLLYPRFNREGLYNTEGFSYDMLQANQENVQERWSTTDKASSVLLLLR